MIYWDFSFDIFFASFLLHFSTYEHGKFWKKLKEEAALSVCL